MSVFPKDSSCNETMPVECPPYRRCCTMYQFCHPTQSTCVSCFPRQYDDTRETKLQFCKDFHLEAASKMRHPSCVGACDSMFGRETFFQETGVGENADSMMIHFVYGAIIAILLGCVGVLCYRLCRRKMPYRIKIKDDSQPLAIVYTSKDDVDVKSKIQIQKCATQGRGRETSATVNASEIEVVELPPEVFGADGLDSSPLLNTGFVNGSVAVNEPVVSSRENAESGPVSPPVRTPGPSALQPRNTSVTDETETVPKTTTSTSTTVSSLPRTPNQDQTRNRTFHLSEVNQHAPSAIEIGTNSRVTLRPS